MATRPRLRRLSLSGRFGDLAASRLAACRTLERLRLRSPALTRDAAALLAAAPSLASLGVASPWLSTEDGSALGSPPFEPWFDWSEECPRCDRP